MFSVTILPISMSSLALISVSFFANSWPVGSMKMKTMIRSSLHQMVISRLQLTMLGQLVGRSAALYISSFYSKKLSIDHFIWSTRTLCELSSLINGNPLSLLLCVCGRARARHLILTSFGGTLIVN